MKLITTRIIYLTVSLFTILLLLTAGIYSSSGNISRINSSIPTHQLIWGGTVDYTAKSVAVDGSGNIYVTGYLQEPGKTYDVFVRKYSSNFTLVWETRWGEDNLHDKAEDIVINPEGLIVITGGREHSPNSGNFNGFVAFFEPTGGYQKGNATFGHDWSQYLWGIDCAVDPTLKLVYTAGDSFYDAFGDYDALYIIWNYTDMLDIRVHFFEYFRAGSPARLTKNDRAYDIKAEANNGFLIVGETESIGGGMYDAFIALYHPSLGYTDFHYINHKTYGTTENEFYQGLVLEKPSDPYSPIYTCGSINKSSDTDYGAAMVKYNSSLDVEWDRMLNRGINETYFDVCLSSDDYLYAAGFSYKAVPGSAADVLMSQWDFSGNNPDNSNWDNKDDDHGYGIIGGLNKEILVCGGTDFTTTTPLSPATYGDAFLIEYGGIPQNITTTNTTTTATNTTGTTTGTPGFTSTTIVLSLITISGSIVVLRRKNKKN